MTRPNAWQPIATIQVREHRGSFADSMDTVEAIEATEDALRHYFDKPGVLTVEPYGHDPRNGWDTYIVAFDGQAMGFTDGPLAPPSGAAPVEGE